MRDDDDVYCACGSQYDLRIIDFVEIRPNMHRAIYQCGHCRLNQARDEGRYTYPAAKQRRRVLRWGK